ncbi:MAG: hypothetical protein KDK45_18345 [Leptospiraceae bacterium]|nr:hypothetical protein [Leptospiraceae bacterium]
MLQLMKHDELKVSKRESYNSFIPARIDETKITENVYYKIYRKDKLENKLIPSVRTCYLQHGYGMEVAMIKFKNITFDYFVHTYYGLGSIDKLLDTACGEVIVAFQESNKTTILEMTERTEKFIRDVVCTPLRPGMPETFSKRCAYIGHSKGGAVAFNLARRCMQKTSLMGENTCEALSEIYSATGVVQGALATFVVRGAYVSKDKETQEQFVKSLGFGLNMVMPLYEDYEPGKTNPTWMDLSPAAPMENNVPLYVVNNIPLKKEGWLKADFAASGVRYKFSGGKRDRLLSCGEKRSFEYNYTACRLFGKNVKYLHYDKLQPAFEEGLNAAKKDPNFSYKRDPYLSEMNWERYQVGDGLADYYLSLNACWKGLDVSEKRAVKSCKTFYTLNHLSTAGASDEALLDIIFQLRN